MGCHFCEERHLKLTPIRAPENLVRAMLHAAELYSDPHLHFYLEASRFNPSATWAHEFAEAYRGAHLSFQWRCETRVDGVHQAALTDLARAGLKILDLGLESGSATQLAAMNKTRDAERYLERGSKMLRHCRDLGIWTKVNVMLYAGETEQTLTETQSWLSHHKDCIKGVSVGPVAVYGHGASARRFLKELRSKGASAVDPGSIERDGYAHLHLSKDVDYDRAKAISLRLAQEFMGDRDYYDLKSFSYLPRGYSYDHFRADMKGLPPDNLPFRAS
jgi:hypothetical protein